jgi:hypothetical protein
MTLQIEGIVRNGRIELPADSPELEGKRVLVSVPGSTRRPASEEERQKIVDDLIDQMRQAVVTGGRGYLLREELYESRLRPARGQSNG